MTNDEREKAALDDVRCAKTKSAREVFLLSEIDRRDEALRGLLDILTAPEGYHSTKLAIEKAREVLGQTPPVCALGSTVCFHGVPTDKDCPLC